MVRFLAAFLPSFLSTFSSPPSPLADQCLPLSPSPSPPLPPANYRSSFNSNPQSEAPLIGRRNSSSSSPVVQAQALPPQISSICLKLVCTSVHLPIRSLLYSSIHLLFTLFLRLSLSRADFLSLSLLTHSSRLISSHQSRQRNPLLPLLHRLNSLHRLLPDQHRFHQRRLKGQLHRTWLVLRRDELGLFGGEGGWGEV